jgi:hypothetical protein
MEAQPKGHAMIELPHWCVGALLIALIIAAHVTRSR